MRSDRARRRPLPRQVPYWQCGVCRTGRYGAERADAESGVAGMIETAAVFYTRPVTDALDLEVEHISRELQDKIVEAQKRQ
jgi:hypothetical protein